MIEFPPDLMDLPDTLKDALEKGTVRQNDVIHLPAIAHRPGVKWGEAMQGHRLTFRVDLASSADAKSDGLVRASIYMPKDDRSGVTKTGAFEGTQREFAQRVFKEGGAA
ncbi:MAG: hypothetical protein LBO05_04095 [Deltaproteobacteria bacterium]|jgi:hypothetical protein|nr:hypothetical protein [Deltaproteobacteria bacterium]